MNNCTHAISNDTSNIEFTGPIISIPVSIDRYIELVKEEKIDSSGHWV